MDMNTFTIKSYFFVKSLVEKRMTLMFFFGVFCCFFVDPVSASITDSMKDAVADLQKEIFGNGWITVGKIAAAAVGGVMAIARSSAVPFAMGAGVAGGLHFFQKYTESAAACVLDMAPHVVTSLSGLS